MGILVTKVYLDISEKTVSDHIKFLACLLSAIKIKIQEENINNCLRSGSTSIEILRS